MEGNLSILKPVPLKQCIMSSRGARTKQKKLRPRFVQADGICREHKFCSSWPGFAVLLLRSWPSCWLFKVLCRVCECKVCNTHPHTHTYAERERESERAPRPTTASNQSNNYSRVQEVSFNHSIVQSSNHSSMLVRPRLNLYLGELA